MELKDVIHFFMGCEAQTSHGVGKLLAITIHGESVKIGVGYGHNFRALRLHDLEEVKPILRRLSSMTEEEAIMLCSLNLPKGWQPGHIIKTNDEDIAAMRIFDMKGDYKTLYIPKNRISPSNFVWLLQHGFDLFGLIESGQAIDRDTLK